MQVILPYEGQSGSCGTPKPSITVPLYLDPLSMKSWEFEEPSDYNGQNLGEARITLQYIDYPADYKCNNVPG